MAMETPTVFDWLIGLAVQTLALVVAGTWRISRAIVSERKEIDHSIANLDHDLSKRIDGVEVNARQSTESAQRLQEATMEAIKSELHEHVVYVERNFARRDSFYRAVEEIKNNMKEGFDRLEEKIDRKIKD